MVNVAHDHHHGSPGHQVLGLILAVVDQLLLDGDHHFLLHLAAHLLSDDSGGVEVDDLAEGGHDAVLHQALDHLSAGLFHPAGQLTHRDLRRDLHGERCFLGDLQLQAAQLLRLLLLALVEKAGWLLFFLPALRNFSLFCSMPRIPPLLRSARSWSFSSYLSRLTLVALRVSTTLVLGTLDTGWVCT